MKLQQLRSIQEVARSGLNISQAADKLFASQPGLSKHIKSLEEELGVEIFTRSGKHLSSVTEVGAPILSVAEEILDRVEIIRSLASEFKDGNKGSLSIATTHTQCRYVLPTVIDRFITKFPEVALHMHQGTPGQISELASGGTADFAIATEALELYTNLVMLPCYRWNRAILLPKSHPLAAKSSLTIEDISKYPIVTYTFGFTGRSKLDEAFKAKGLLPKVVFTAADADVIKTYVRLGLGIGIVAKMAWDPVQDSDLVAVDASQLFESSVTNIGFRAGTHLRGYMYDFIQMFAPHLSKDRVQLAMEASTKQELEQMFAKLELPEH